MVWAWYRYCICHTSLQSVLIYSFDEVEFMNIKTRRNIYLFVGVVTMLFSGVLYAWSILKIPFAEEFCWSAEMLATNFTLTMTFFCLGAFFGSIAAKKFGVRNSLLISAFLTGSGFIATGFLNASSEIFLFITYAFLAGSGIGISYNVVVSTVTSWIPDKKGFSSGCLMLGFGLSTLLLGNLIDNLYKNDLFGRKNTFILIGVLLFVVLVFSALILRKPDEETVLPEVQKSSSNKCVKTHDFTTKEMLGSFTFWKAFICMTFLTAVGNSAISFARDLALSVNASAQFATTMVGILAVCNGFGRILTGAVFDKFGRKTAMYASNVITIVSAAVTLFSIIFGSLPLCVAGLCLIGISYGSCPTVTSAFTSAFFGQKHFSVNYSIMNFNLIIASVIAGISNKLLIISGGYVISFAVLLILSVVAMVLNLTIKQPQ